MSDAVFTAQRRRVDARARSVFLRRAFFFALVAITCGLAVSTFHDVLASDGLSYVEVAMTAAFALTTPWVAIGFWNAVIGFILLRFSADPLKAAAPELTPRGPARPVRGRTALAMAIHNEDALRVFRGLRATWDSLIATGDAGRFSLHVLSDTTDPRIAAEEARLFREWRATAPHGARLHYRRRDDNTGHKVGNIWEFLSRAGRDYDYMIPLDADSVMTGPAILSAVRTMDANPRLGLLQTLVVAMPARSPFARLFQFGMRHGMRSYTTGSAWWQADAGPYWGHNAVIRVAPFMQHCRLPRLPGSAPLGGEILSHDQIEAALMRAADYDVRVMPVEGGSYEENPPTLPDFIARDLRWCQGNMQYLRLLTRPGFRWMGRLQIALAILMYVSPVAWFTFMGLGFAQSVTGGLTTDRPEAAIALFSTMMFMTFAPKILGVAQSFADARRRAAYGGGGRLLRGAAVELLFGMVVGPIMALAETIFVIGLFFGKRIRWTAQNRADRALEWGESLRGLWPQTALGVVGVVGLALYTPATLPWALPVLLPLALAVPFAVLSSRPDLGAWMTRNGLAAMPEEAALPRELRAVLGPTPTPAAVRGGRRPTARTSDDDAGELSPARV